MAWSNVVWIVTITTIVCWIGVDGGNVFLCTTDRMSPKCSHLENGIVKLLTVTGMEDCIGVSEKVTCNETQLEQIKGYVEERCTNKPDCIVEQSDIAGPACAAHIAYECVQSNVTTQAPETSTPIAQDKMMVVMTVTIAIGSILAVVLFMMIAYAWVWLKRKRAMKENDARINAARAKLPPPVAYNGESIEIKVIPASGNEEPSLHTSSVSPVETSKLSRHVAWGDEEP